MSVVTYLESSSASLRGLLQAGYSSNVVADELFQRLRLASEWKARRVADGDAEGAELIQGYIWEIVNAWDRFSETALANGRPYYSEAVR
jgi:hypothetical protein